jgi:hypothetical protein
MAAIRLAEKNRWLDCLHWPHRSEPIGDINADHFSLAPQCAQFMCEPGSMLAAFDISRPCQSLEKVYEVADRCSNADARRLIDPRSKCAGTWDLQRAECAANNRCNRRLSGINLLP